MVRSWAASLIAVVLLLGCTEDVPPAGGGSPRGEESQSASQGWMGRFGRRDPALATLLQRQPGWAFFRDMELLDAIQAFTGSGTSTDRLGAARSYLVLADLFGSLDALFLEAEDEYLSALGPELGSAERVRRAYVWLRRGKLDRARPEFDREASGPGAFAWVLGRAGLAAVEGRVEDATRLREQIPSPAADAEKVLGQVACFFWGVSCAGGGRGPYGQAIAAFRRGDLAGGIMALQRLDLQSGGEGADPGLFLYPLLRRAFAGLALAAVGEPATPGEAFLAGEARGHLGEWENAAQQYSRAAKGFGPGGDPVWLFSPVHGPGDAAEVAQVLRGGAMCRAGRAADAMGPWRELARGTPGPLALAWLAALQAELGLSEPLGAPENAAASAMAAVAAAPGEFAGDGAEVLASLYSARQAAVSRLAAQVYRKAGDRQRAADILDGAHRKASGYRPDFTSPPGYLVDLAREYGACGEYAPAVAVLFELAGDYPSARLGYESLKRLYASRTGGEVPPR